MKEDEARHAEHAEQAGARKLPQPIDGPFGRLGGNVFSREDAWRIVVVTCPAESTALRTTARDLNEKPIAHFCFRRPDGCRRAEGFLIDEKLSEFLLTTLQCAAQRSFFRINRRDRTADAFGDAFLVWQVIKNGSVLVLDDVVE